MDQQLFHLINERWTSPALDLFMAAISDADVWKPLLVIVLFAALIFGGFRARACIFCLLIAIAIAEPVTNTLKSAINRKRPKHEASVRMVRLEKGRPEFMSIFKKPVGRRSDESDRRRGDPSFPSGHMTNNTIAAICDFVLPAGVALLDFHGAHRLFASLFGRALAKRRGRHSFFGRSRNILYSGGAGIDLAMGNEKVDA